MSKRILSFALALVMLVLAVPVFALPALAAEADPTIKFAVGPTGTTGLNTVGTVVKETTVSKKGYPTPADIEKAGVTLDLDEVIGWYAYDKETDEFYSVKAYYAGYLTATDGMIFYPITKTTYMQGYYSGRYAGANQPLWTANPSENANDNNKIYYYNSEIKTYTGGWVLGAFENQAFLPFTQAGDTAYAIFTTRISEEHNRVGGYYPLSGNISIQTYTDRTGLSNFAAAYAFSAVASGTVKITIPAADKANCVLAIVKNDAYVWPSAIAGKTASAASAEKESWGALKYAATTTAIYQEANITDTLTLDVQAGDRIYFMLANTAAASQPYFYPTVSYTNITEVPLWWPYTSNFRDNRPSFTGDLANQGDSEAVSYEDNWDYVYYSDGKKLQKPEQLTKRYRSSSYASQSWLYPANEIVYNTVFVFAGGSEAGSGGSGMWQKYGMGVINGRIIGTRYTAERTGNIKVSFDRLLNNYIVDANRKTVLEYAIYVNGEKVWPVNDTGDWYAVSYYGANIPQSFKDADANVIGEIGTDFAATVNATMPGEIAIEAGQTVEFLLYTASHESYTSGATELTACSGADLYASRSGGNYVDGTVEYIFRDAPIVQEGIVSEFRDNRPDISSAVGGNTNGENEPAVYKGNWDYIAYKGGKKLTTALPLVTRRVISNYKESWFLPEGDTVYNYSAVYACSPATEGQTSNTWRGYSMGAEKGRVIGTRYTAEYTGNVKVSFDRLLNVQIRGANYKNVVEYAIYVNGEKVWPVNDTGDWYTVSYYGDAIPQSFKEADKNFIGTIGEDFSATVNATMPGEIAVEAGQTVEFLMHAVSLETYTEGAESLETSYYIANYACGHYVDGMVTYTKAYPAPAVEAGVRVGGELSIYGQTSNTVPYNGYGVYLNGEKISMNEYYNTQFEVKVAAADADKIQTVQPYYILNGKEIKGKTYEISMGDILEKYVESGDAEVVKAAQATLDYTTAAEIYFNKEATEAPAIVAPTNKDDYVAKGDSIGAVNYEGEGEVKFRGISLLLNDLINIKIVVNGTLPEGASLQISKDADFAELETEIVGKATEDGTGTKFIMDGISAKNWNTDYYIRVVDESGKAISDTLCYSVAAYYGRMIENEAATDKLKAVISSLMALYEAVSTAN